MVGSGGATDATSDRETLDQPRGKFALSGAPMDFEGMPAIQPGRCNCCGGPLPEGAQKLCSAKCRAFWRAQMQVLGAKIAERLLFHHVNRHGDAAERNRAKRETDRLVGEFWQRLKEARRSAGFS